MLHRIPGFIGKLGTAARRNVGVAATNVVALDTSAKLPAVDGSQLTNLAAASVPRSYLAGLGLSRLSVSNIGIAPGSCVSDDQTTLLTLGAGAGQKNITLSFSAGLAGNGSLDAGSVAANTWYHVYLIGIGAASVDVLTSLSAASPTFPASYTKKRRIGSIKTDGSSQIVAFIQDGDTFQWSTIVQDIAAVNPGTTAVTRTMTTPLGVRVEGIFQLGGITTSTVIDFSISDLSVNDEAPSSVGATASVESAGSVTQLVVGNQRVFTNTSSQIRSRAGASGADLTFYISTRGWRDTRGRDA